MKDVEPLGYPENGYYAIFGAEAKLPPDAEATLEHVVGSLTDREADMFMLRYKQEMTLAEIGDKYGLTREGARRIICKAERRLRHPSRSEILLVGREVYLASIATENEERNHQYVVRISALEEKIRTQDRELAKYRERLLVLNKQVDPAFDVLDTSIKELVLSARSWNCLTRAGIKTIKDLLDYGDIGRVRNLGQKSVQEVQEKLQAFLWSQNQLDKADRNSPSKDF